MRNRTLIKAMTVAVLSCTPMISLGQEPIGAPQTTQPQQQQAQPIGRVTAAFGQARADTAAGSHPLDIQSLINNDERIVTDGGGLTILLASRVVMKVDVESAVSVFESPTQTTVSVQKGTVHLYVGQRPATAGVVSVQDPNGRTETASGVFLAHYDPGSHQSYIACEHQAVNVTPKGELAPLAISGDQQAIIRDGKVIMTGNLDRVAFNDVKKSLDRLGQATVSRGAETFRLRSRAFDTESAISQLSAAGWIDRRTLPTTPVAAAGNSTNGSSSSSSSSGGATSLTEVNTGESIKGSKTNKGNGNSNATANSNDASNGNSSTVVTAAPAPTPTPSPMPASDLVPGNTPAPSNAAPTGTLTLGTPPQQSAPQPQPTATPAPSLTITPPANTPTTPVVQIDLGNNTPTGHGAPDGVIDTPPGSPVAALPTQPPTNIDLGSPDAPVSKPGNDGWHKGAKSDKGAPKPDKVDKDQGAPTMPKVDIGLTGLTPAKDMGSIKTELPVAVPTNTVTAPPVTLELPRVTDIGIVPKDTTPTAAPTLPVTIDQSPRDSAPPTPKVDLGLGSNPIQGAPTSAIPKTDIGAIKDPSIGLPTRTDVDLGAVKDLGSVAPTVSPKDGTAGAKDATADVKDDKSIPKIDLGLDVKVGDDKAGGALTGVLPGATDVGSVTAGTDVGATLDPTDAAKTIKDPTAGATDPKSATADPTGALPTPDQLDAGSASADTKTDTTTTKTDRKRHRVRDRTRTTKTAPAPSPVPTK